MAQAGISLAGNDTGLRRRATDFMRPAYFADAAPRATFISQLLAEHRHLPRGPVAQASGAYDAAKRSAVARLPAGYRATRSA